MEMIYMKSFIRPLKRKKMNSRLTSILANELSHAPAAPMDKLNKEAREFEKLVLARRSSLSVQK